MSIGIFGHVSGDIVSELIFLRYKLELGTQRPVSTFVSEDSEEEDGDDEQDEEDERLRCLRFFLRDLHISGEGEDFSVDEDEEVLL